MRGRRRARPGGDAFLTESPTDVMHDNPDLVLGYPEESGAHGTQLMGVLGGDVDLEVPGVGVPAGHDAASLHGYIAWTGAAEWSR